MIHAFVHECSNSYSYDHTFKCECLPNHGKAVVSWSGHTPDGLMTGLGVFTMDGKARLMWTHSEGGPSETTEADLAVSLECYNEGQGKEEVDAIVDELHKSDDDFGRFMNDIMGVFKDE
jgi:hypothetical protein